MKSAIVIPVRGEAYFTDAITSQLLTEEFDRCFISDNAGDDKPTQVFLQQLQSRDKRFVSYIQLGLGITHQWNVGWSKAEQELGSDTAVLFLNNDVELTSGTVRLLRRMLEENDEYWIIAPDYQVPAGTVPSGLPRLREVKGTYRNSGIPGWCFMVRPGVPAQIGGRFDERWVWWASDDQLIERVSRAGGKIGIVNNLGLTHANEGTAVKYPELHEQKHRDMQLYEAWLRGQDIDNYYVHLQHRTV